MAPYVKSKNCCLKGKNTSRELLPIHKTHRKNHFQGKHQTCTNTTSNKKYAAKRALKALRVGPTRVHVPKLSDRFDTSEKEDEQIRNHGMIIQLKPIEIEHRRKVLSFKRPEIRPKNPVATTSSRTRHVARCPPPANNPPSMTNITNTPTTSTSGTDDGTHDGTIYYSAKSDVSRFKNSIRGRRLRHSHDQSSVKGNAENDGTSYLDDTYNSPSTIYHPDDGTENDSSAERLSAAGSSHEESFKTCVENSDTGNSRSDSTCNISPILRRRPIRHGQVIERFRGSTESMDEPTPRNQQPFARQDDERLVTSTSSVSRATIKKRKLVHVLREAVKHLKGFVEKLETVIEMADEDHIF